MKKLAGFCFVLWFAVFTAHAEEGNRWEAAIQKFEAADAASSVAPGQILFVGSSSIVYWKTLAEDLAPLPVVNRGFGGSQFSDLLEFTSRIVLPYAPSIIAVYEGDNDIAFGKSAERVTDDWSTFVSTVRSELPDTTICFIAIKPSLSRAALWPVMEDANSRIAASTEADDSLCYLDVATPMLLEEGGAKPDLFVEDGLHMNANGYRIWTDVVRPKMLELYRETGSD